MRLTAKLITKCEPIIQTTKKGTPWLVGYRLRRDATKTFKLGMPLEMTPKISMQCVNCIHAPHVLSPEKVAEFNQEQLGRERPAWCPLQQDYPREKCTFHKLALKPEKPSIP